VSAAPVIAAVVALAGFPSAANVETTPDGPATLTSTSLSSVAGTVGGLPVGGGSGQRVLMRWTVTVGAGGQAGLVRPVVGGVSYDPVELPATPGTYTFPAPRVAVTGALGVQQETGRHAIVTREGCRPEIERFSDPCETKWVDIQRPGQADVRDRGAQLAVSWDTEPDVDGDLRGDLTEDRTDLRVSAVPARDPDGRLRIAVTLTNAGSIPADVPSLDSSLLSGARWEGACLPQSVFPRCLSTPLAAGESRVLVIRAEDPAATTATITTSSEGQDLAPVDNSTAVAFAPAPPFAIVPAKAQHLSRGIKVDVRAVRAGPARLTAAFKVRGHTITLARTVTLAPNVARTVTLRPGGAKLRSLRRHAPLTAEIRVRTPGEADTVTATTRVR
jgi:hypothetical protein